MLIDVHRLFTDIYFGCKKPLLFRELLGTRARQVPVAFRRFSVGTINLQNRQFCKGLGGARNQRKTMVFRFPPKTLSGKPPVPLVSLLVLFNFITEIDSSHCIF